MQEITQAEINIEIAKAFNDKLKNQTVVPIKEQAVAVYNSGGANIEQIDHVVE